MLNSQGRGVELRFHLEYYFWSEHPWRRVMSRHIGPTADPVGRLLAARPSALYLLHGGYKPPCDKLDPHAPG
jgi:hypothetical protein